MADQDECRPDCPDGFHHHYYSGSANPTRVSASVEAAMQVRAAEQVQRYAGTVMWTDADGCFVDSWRHSEPDTMANVLRMLAGVAERPTRIAHVRIEPVHQDDASGG